MAKSFLPIMTTIAYVVWAFLVPAQADIKLVSKKFETHRLPRNVIPLHYDILLNLDSRSRDGLYHGFVGVNFQVVGQSSRNKFDKIRDLLNCFGKPEPLAKPDADQCELIKPGPNEIVVHVDQIILLKSIQVFEHKSGRSRDKKLKIKELAHDQINQMLIITLDKRLKPGSLGRLEFDYDLRPRNDLRGVYERTYEYGGAKDEITKRRFIASRFQPSDARLAIPCFDEPEYKTNFELSLIHSVNERALSNTPVLEQTILEKDNSLMQTKFRLTSVMSIHMLAFAVGDFECVERERAGMRETTVRVYTMPGQKEAAEFALEVAYRSLEWMEKYTNVLYSLGKFDVVAINDHDKDNYESWGLAFIRSNLTLIDKETSPVQKISTAINVAHVVAHQWFGNLITVDWWTQIWITEGIAAHLGFEMVQELYPGHASEYFTRLATLSSVLDADSDASRSSNVLVPNDSSLKTSEEILSIFNVNGYMKSASLFQLIMNDLGRKQFRRTLQVLLLRNVYGSINLGDLSKSIEGAANRGSGYLEKFYSQLHRVSYPIVKVDILAGSDSSLSIFSENIRTKELGLSCEFGDVTNAHERERIELAPLKQGIILSQPSWFNISYENHWLKLNPNPDLSTYFRMKYDYKLLVRNMKLAIEQKHLSSLDRLHILDDTVGLVQAGRVAPETLKQLLAHYSQEDHGAVILAVLKATKALSTFELQDETHSPAFRAFEAMYERYGFEAILGWDGTLVNMRAQMATLSALVDLQAPKVIEDALQKFDLHNGLVPEIYLRAPIYNAVVIDGNKGRVERLILHLHETSSNDEQMRLMDALLESKDEKILGRLSEWIAQSKLTHEMKQQQLVRLHKI